MDGRSSAIAIVTEPQFMSFIKLNNAGMHVPMSSPVSDESTSNSGAPQKNDCQTPRARSRRKAPKVRSGCVTCKKRRVKCDERKPGCYRCEKFGAQCDGYATNKQKPWTIFQGHLPGDARQSESRAVLDIKSPSITALQPRRTAFSSQQEYSYFQVFSQRTASSIAGYFTGTLWNRLILQACEHHPSVRHAIIAIGALDRTLDGAPSIRSLTDVKDGLEPPTMHHAFALQQYGKAVKLMRDALTDSQPDMRITLITCLLAFCFETFHGNRQSALTHAQSGIKMLNSWLPTLRRNGNYSVGSPAPEVIEDELVQAFATLDCDTISFHAEVPPIPEVIAVDARRTMDAMPIVFEDLGTARVFLDFTRRMAIHFLASSYAWDFASSGDGATQQFPTIRPWQHHPESIAQWNRHCEALLRWNSAFQPLLSKARHDKGADLVNAIGIELRFRATYASFASTLVPEAHFEIASADFNVVLNIAEELSRAYSTYDIRERPSYMFDGSYVGSLLVFITHCRDPVLRRRGIRLLEEVPRREGIWDSMVGAKLCRTIIEIEEEGWNGIGEIPWNNRVRFMRPTFDMHERKGRLSYKTEVQLGSDGPMSIKDFHW